MTAVHKFNQPKVPVTDTPVPATEAAFLRVATAPSSAQAAAAIAKISRLSAGVIIDNPNSAVITACKPLPTMRATQGIR
ncbi:hypothetical protein AWC15_20340 [Mycobacterium lacus]|nr:hypothetical protein AWC15_20340 [Mycobacterium lacus]